MRAEQLAGEYGLEFVQPYVLANRARAQIGMRQFALAGRSLTELARRASDPIGYFDTHLRVARCGLYLSVGDLDRARGTVILGPGRRVGKPLRGQYLALRALTQAASGDGHAATTSAAYALRSSRAAEVRATVGTASAIVALSDGRTGDATAAITGVADTGAWEGFVLGCRACRDVATHAASIPQLHEDLLAMLTRSRDEALGRKIDLRIPRSARRSELLSPRELEIHELIAQGLTNDEIAKLLYISPSTTKVHVRHILEKLGVRSRVEAARIWQASKA